MALTEQHQNFNDRVKRIERDHGIGGGMRRGKRSSGTREAVYHCGVEETISAEQMRRAREAMRGKGEMTKRDGIFKRLLGLPISFAMGVIGVALAWYGIFFYTGGGTATHLTPDARLAMGIVAGLAVAAVLLVRLFISSSLTAHSLMQGMGVIVGVALLHNVVHLYPEQWAMFFSDGWVRELTGITQSRSIMLPGVTIPIDKLL